MFLFTLLNRKIETICSKHPLAIVCFTFLLLGIIQFPEVLNGNLRWDERMSEYLPWRLEQARILASGEFPLFSDKVFSGNPILGIGYTGALYPPNWIYIFSGVHFSNVITLFHTVIGGLGFFLYLKRFRIHPVAAYCGAVFFLTMTFHSLHSGHVSMRETGLIAPWVLYLTSLMMQKLTLKRFALLALLIGIQFSIGYPQIVLFTLILSGFEVIRHANLKRIFFSKFIALFLAAILGVACLAVMIMVTQSTIEQSIRTELTVDYWQEASFNPFSTILYAMPMALGHDAFSWKGFSYPLEVINVVHPAALVLSFFSIPLLFKSKKRTITIVLYSIVALLTFFFSWGEFLPVHKYFFHIPLVGSFRIPSRWLFITNVCICILSTHGIHALLKTRKNKIMHFVKYIGIYLAIFGIGLLMHYGYSQSIEGDTSNTTSSIIDSIKTNYKLQIELFTIFAIGLSLLFSIRKPVYLSCVVLIFCTWQSRNLIDGFLIGAQDYTQITGRSVNPTLDQNTPEDLGRILPLYEGGEGLLPELLMHNSNLFRGYKSAGGYSPLYFLNIRNMVGFGQDGGTWYKSNYLDNPNPLRHFGINHLILVENSLSEEEVNFIHQNRHDSFKEVFRENGILILELQKTKPRAEVLHHVFANLEIDDSIRAIWNYDILQTGPFPVDSMNREIPEEVLNQQATFSNILEEDYRNNQQYFKVETDAPAMFVVRDMNWKGWMYEVYQDGKLFGSGPTYSVFHLFRGVPVPAGVSEVKMTYSPPGLKTGLIISLISLVLILILFFAGFSSNIQNRFDKLIGQ